MARACKFSVATIIYSSHSSFFALCISIRSLFFTNTLQTAEQQEQLLQQSSDAATDGCIGSSAVFWCGARKQTVARVNGAEDGNVRAGELAKCIGFRWESFSRGWPHEREREECQDSCQGKPRASSSGIAKQIVERLYISKKNCSCVMNLMARGRIVRNVLNFAFESLFSFCSVSNQF